jgi:hypothetical protein
LVGAAGAEPCPSATGTTAVSSSNDAMSTQRRVRPFRTAKYGRRRAALTSSNLKVILATPWISNSTRQLITYSLQERSKHDPIVSLILE